jgi:hypothetical protein
VSPLSLGLAEDSKAVAPSALPGSCFRANPSLHSLRHNAARLAKPAIDGSFASLTPCAIKASFLAPQTVNFGPWTARQGLSTEVT